MNNQPSLSNFCVLCESPEQIRPVVEWMNENAKTDWNGKGIEMELFRAVENYLKQKK